MSDKKEGRTLWDNLNNFDVAFDGTKTAKHLYALKGKTDFRVGSNTSSHRIKMMNCAKPDGDENLRKQVKKAQSSVDQVRKPSTG